MCDCYSAPCAGCGKLIEMHLVDYATGRDEVAVFCGECLPPATPATIFWRYGDECPDRICAVVALTDNALSNAEGNHPNYYELERAEPPAAAGKEDGDA